MEARVIESGDRCRCGGEVDKLYLISENPDIWQGRCFQCGWLFIVLHVIRESAAKELVEV